MNQSSGHISRIPRQNPSRGPQRGPWSPGAPNRGCLVLIVGGLVGGVSALSGFLLALHQHLA